MTVLWLRNCRPI